MSPQLSFFERTMAEIGFNEKIDFGIYDPMPDAPESRKLKKSLFEEDEHGNIVFNIMDIEGFIKTHDYSESKSNHKIRPIQIIRYRDPKDDGKYKPISQGLGVHPWIGREMVEAFKVGKKVKRLILTEGYKKAHVLLKNGLFCFGLPGITVWKDKEAKDVFADIRRFIDVCKVEDILWLTDSDTMKVTWEPGKDLFKRPNLFYKSIVMFKEFFRDTSCNLYYAYVNPETKEKGIDDVFLAFPKEKERIIKDLTQHSGVASFLVRHNIFDWTYRRIAELFAIHADASAFYERYSQEIGLDEFIYRGGLYSYNEDTKKLDYRRSGESTYFAYVGSEIYLRCAMPDETNAIENILIPIKERDIKKMYQSKPPVEVNKIITDIEYYNGFINRPGHFAQYESVIPCTNEDGFVSRWFNKYMPLTHRVMDYTSVDQIENSLAFIKHIFGNETISANGVKYIMWELGLDYIQIMLQYPTQPLPILSLLSSENQTGKTQFWNWMCKIFQQNAKIIPASMLTSQFSAFYVNLLLLIIDEALLDKMETMNKVKAMTTNNRAVTEDKNVKASTTQTYLKIGLSSNQINDFAIITKNDERFFPIDVPVIPNSAYKSNFTFKLYSEIPFFISFLQKRTLVSENVDRMWFHKDLRKTSALERVIRNSRPSSEILIESTIKNYMTAVDKMEVCLSFSDIIDLTGDKTMTMATVRWIINNRWEKQSLGYSRPYIFYKLNTGSDMESEDNITPIKKKTDYYTFKASEFFTSDKILEAFKKREIIDYDKSLVISIKNEYTAKQIYEKWYSKTCKFFDFENCWNETNSLHDLETSIENLFEKPLPF